MTSIAISTGSLATASAGGQSAGNDSSIAGLKQKLAALNKSLREALNESSEAGMQKAKGIQMQIQIAQAKLEQLIQQQAEKASKQQEKPAANTAVMQSRHQGQIDVYA
ncbi:hypothetical protein [Methylophilus sp.]|uniref:hypothetical protein n=1 Tax=Methylophilus sp. TaxID=29541 RepID=UPI004036900F